MYIKGDIAPVVAQVLTACPARRVSTLQSVLFDEKLSLVVSLLAAEFGWSHECTANFLTRS